MPLNLDAQATTGREGLGHIRFAPYNLIKLDPDKGGPTHTHMLICFGSRQL